MKNILLAATALGIWGSASQAQEGPKEVDLKCAAKPDKNRAKIRLEGTATLPEGTVLRITLYRLQEQALSGRLAPASAVNRTSLAAVEQKKFSFSATVDGPGGYQALVELLEEDQSEATLAKLKSRAGGRQWTFTLDLWGEDFISALPGRLSEVDGYAGEIAAIVGKFEMACASADAWKRDSKDLLKEAGELLKRVSGAEMQRVYSAAGRDLTYVLRNLIASSDLLRWNANGGYEGAWDYHTNTKQKTFKQHEFSFGALKRYCDDSAELAGRELGLWLLRELRHILAARDRAVAASKLREIVKAATNHPGFAETAKTFGGWCDEIIHGVSDERVAKLTAELAALEKPLRGEKDKDEGKKSEK